MGQTIVLRPADAADVAPIDALLRAAFPRADEATLVRNLCIDGDMVLVVVAEDEENRALAGMVAFSQMHVVAGGKAVPSVALAPIAVARPHRHRGVAEALIRAGLDRLEQAGVVLCFVLGDPAFYTRFGFATDLAGGYDTPYAGDHLMALALQGGLVPCGERGRADHAPAFARLGDEG